MTLVVPRPRPRPEALPAAGVLAQVTNLKNELVDHETFAGARPTNHFEQTLAEAYTRLPARLRQANALDFDDLIMSTVALLQAFPDVAEHYRRRFRHVLVDEYQDTNHAQYVLVRELSGRGDGGVPPGRACVVGDADQSIYAFRGATIRNIVEFESDYPDATTILLEQNYRSTQTILSAANAVIARNTRRRAKQLWTDAGDGAPIVGYVADDEHDEAAFVAKEIDRLADDAGRAPGDVAVFYRTNAQSRSLEEVFIRVGLPYKVVGGVRFYERKRDPRRAGLPAAAWPTPTTTCRCAASSTCPRAASATGPRRCSRPWPSASASVRRGAAPRRRGPGAGDAVADRRSQAFAQLMSDLRTLVEAGAGPATVLAGRARADRLPRRAAGLRRPAGRDPRREPRRARVGGARSSRHDEPEGTLADFLERVSLVADADEIPDAEDHGGVVTLMTLHTAKGLEFPVVFLTGMEDGVFPHMRSLGDTGELEEERGWPTSGSPGPGSGCTCRAPSCARPGARRRTTRVALPRGDPRRAGRLGARETIRRGRRPASSAGSGGALAARRRHAARGELPGQPPVVSLSAGDRVTHDTFGLGTVVSTSGAASGPRPRSTSAPPAPSGCCCATPRWRASDVAAYQDLRGERGPVVIGCGRS